MLLQSVRISACVPTKICFQPLGYKEKIAPIAYPEGSKNKRQISAAVNPVRSNPDFSGKKWQNFHNSSGT